MKVLGHRNEATQPLVSTFTCPAVYAFSTSLAKSLVPIDRSLLPDFSTWANTGDVFEHFEQNIGAAVGGGRVIVAHVNAEAVALSPHYLRVSYLRSPKKSDCKLGKKQTF